MSQGVDFPVDKEGKRPTTTVNQGAIAAAIKAHDSDAHQAVENEKKWRFGYAKHVVRQTQVATKSEQTALGIATDGLEYLHSTMDFARDGASMSVKTAMAKFRDGTFETLEVKGSGAAKTDGLEVPYCGRTLRGDEVKAQAETWVRKGVIELDTGAALSKVADTPDWLDLSDHTFVLFGAGSAMGPFPILMALGAHVVAIDLPRPQIWTRLLSIARSSPGKLTVPLKESAPKGASDEDIAKIAGCDLLGQTPEVRNWLLKTLASSQKVVLGGYCYADGPLFVRVSMAMDAIIKDLVSELKVKPAIAYLCTPTDALVCSASSKVTAMDNLKKSTWWQPLVGKLLGFAKMGLSPNRVKGESALPVVDALVKDQGPNYCLAKRLQHWRAILSRKDGCIVSSNIAPATATVSVVSNKSFALAYKGMHFFKPMEVFQPETSNAVMLALLVNDLRNPLSAGQPATRLQNPMQLFAATAFHGGAWRCGYTFGSIGPSSAVAYIVTGMIVKAYLVMYNAVQALGWAYALFLFATQGAPAAEGVIARFTYLQIAEVVHSLTGMVPSGALTTGMQIASRVGIVQVVTCAATAESRSAMSFFLHLFYVCWSVTEVVRYSWYAVNTAGVKIFPLTWLRYSTFLLLYPLGITGELGTVYKALPEMTRLASEPCGLSGSAGILAVGVYKLGFPGLLGVYAICFPMLFGLMLAQRKKALGKKADSAGKKKN
jgi:hypothetical protein